MVIYECGTTINSVLLLFVLPSQTLSMQHKTVIPDSSRKENCQIKQTYHGLRFSASTVSNQFLKINAFTYTGLVHAKLQQWYYNAV